MRDGIAFAKRDLPTSVIVIHEFAKQAAFVAEAESLPDIPVVVLPEPVAGRPPEQIRAAAEAHADDVLRGLGWDR